VLCSYCEPVNVSLLSGKFMADRRRWEDKKNFIWSDKVSILLLESLCCTHNVINTLLRSPSKTDY